MELKKLLLIFLMALSVGACGQGNFFMWHNTTPVNISGLNQLAVAINGDIYRSTDFGVTWTPQLLANSDWLSCSMSNDGNYALICHSGVGYVVKGFPLVDIPSLNSSWDWDSNAVSSTGQYQLASNTTAVGSPGYVYESSDYGITWNRSSIAIAYWGYTCISGSGEYGYVASISNDIYKSTNYGFSFAPITAPTGTTNIYDITTNYSGQYVYVVSVISGNSYLYRSSDYGASWGSFFALNTNTISKVAVSASGQYVTVIESATNHVHYSEDYGISWNLVTLGGVSFESIDMDSSGKYQLIATSTYLHRSTDFGHTWSQITSAGNRTWKDVAL